MLGLSATPTAKEQLRALKSTNPALFQAVSDRIGAVRDDPGGKNAGRTFMLDDGRAARLATFYDAVRGTDLCLVWRISDDGQGPSMVVVWAAPFDPV